MYLFLVVRVLLNAIKRNSTIMLFERICEALFTPNVADKWFAVRMWMIF